MAWLTSCRGGRAGLFLLLTYPVDISNVSGMMLVQNCLQSGSCCRFPHAVGTSDEQCTLRRRCVDPIASGDAAAGET